MTIDAQERMPYQADKLAGSAADKERAAAARGRSVAELRTPGAAEPLMRPGLSDGAAALEKRGQKKEKAIEAADRLDALGEGVALNKFRAGAAASAAGRAPDVSRQEGGESSRGDRPAESILSDSFGSFTPLVTEWRGDRSGINTLRTVVVLDNDDWRRLWSDLRGPGSPPPPPGDFQHNMVVGVCLGNRPSGGYDVEISAMALTPEVLIVRYRETSPAPDQAQTQALTQPFHLRLIPRTRLPVRFIKDPPR